MEKQQQNRDEQNEELSLEQQKYRDKVENDENLLNLDKKLGGPNRPSE
jgi:hypothetical protein